MITFGTSGWRGVIGEDFTFEKVRLATQGIVNYLEKNGPTRTGVIVGYDTRFLSEKFALEAAKILAFNGIQAYLCDRDVPTPCVAFETVRRKAVGAINFTASHNPPEYNGLKFSTATGAAAMPEVTRAIEAEIRTLQDRREQIDVYEKPELIEMIDPKGRYFEELRTKIDSDVIKKSGLRIGIDSLYGTARDYLDYFLLEDNVQVKIIHNYRDPYFGGFSPEVNLKNLADLRKLVQTEQLDLGLATDGDADRFGIIDERGRFVSANVIIALVALYLKRYRKIPGGLARSVATTHLVDAIAQKLDVPLYETPVGFKYIGELILQDKIALGGEESAGLTMYRHLPEKDGILACLLVAEMVAATGKRIHELTEDMMAEFGPYFTKRIDMKVTPQLAERLAERLANPPGEIGGMKVEKINTLDGVKFHFRDNAWLLFRMSGTEPLVRIYAESCRPNELKGLVDIARKFMSS